MTGVRWEKYPSVGRRERAGEWLEMQANLGLAPNTIDAYGRALDVPCDLRRLASSDADVRAEALWQLGGSIFHQGDVFDSTAAAPRLDTISSAPTPGTRSAARCTGTGMRTAFKIPGNPV